MTHSRASDALSHDTLTLAGGGKASVALPETLSRAEFEELRDWLALMQRKAERRVVDQPAGPGEASETVSRGSSREDDDSLSWE